MLDNSWFRIEHRVYGKSKGHRIFTENSHNYTLSSDTKEYNNNYRKLSDQVDKLEKVFVDTPANIYYVRAQRNPYVY